MSEEQGRPKNRRGDMEGQKHGDLDKNTPKNAGKWMFSHTKRRVGPHNAQYDLSVKLCSASPCHLRSGFKIPVLNLQAIKDDSCKATRESCQRQARRMN